ncbi:hypothetical protein T265_01790 [Opisthorchis viverrini]|uniref:Uncharacterized protein n=1 Tax=Opisthorchis viverrini TaxID=6198 RepID=A0A075A905_OPIVI|nr:hypothetical protein T265_01790 [Opisthorchis viverrini]KER32180.1 hypothetical protein T265_01790 [Opisthorchis viverrini]
MFLAPSRSATAQARSALAAEKAIQFTLKRYYFIVFDSIKSIANSVLLVPISLSHRRCTPAPESLQTTAVLSDQGKIKHIC